MRLSFLAALLSIAAFGGFVQAQEDRFGRFEPGLIVQTGSRMAACDVLRFTPDGKNLLAAGDDKIVPIWRCTEQGLDREPVQVLRWSSFREQKGAIYALALSPDSEHVAIGGAGVRVGAAAILNRSTGDVELGLIDRHGENFAIWSIAFSPSGKRVAAGKGDGSIALWDLDRPKHREGNRIDETYRFKHAAGEQGFNAVRTVSFTRENQLISAAEDGEVLRWDLGEQGATGRKAEMQFRMKSIYRAAVSSDGKWIAAINQNSRQLSGQVAVFDESYSKPADIFSAGDDVPHCLAFDPTNRQRLAIGFRSIPPPSDEKKVTFHYETNGKIVIYLLKEKTIIRETELPISYYPEAVQFSPDGSRLAVAGGDNHEVTLWDLRQHPPTLLSTIGGPGTAFWGVALSTKGHLLGFRDHRNLKPDTPNDRGTGPWRVFDLDQRKWTPNQLFQPVTPITTSEGWKVEFDLKNSLIWYVVPPGKDRIALPFDSSQDQLPRCYTFLPRTANRPLRLAVGHCWGVSIFELSDGKVRRSRLLIGHQGEVMALGLSADQQMLVSAGRDQTIAGWTLADWPSQPDWGVRFQLRQSKIVVDEVDAGSPAWDAGLTRGDEVLSFVFNGIDMYDPDKLLTAEQRQRFKNTYTTPEACLRRLREPMPGKEFFFLLRREGQPKPVKLLTRGLHRPLWRFLPLSNGEWVLWRWRDYYYDASTNGDSYIGWQVNGDVDKTPIFYRAEQFRQRFNRPDKVAEALSANASPEKIVFTEIEPPDVRLRASTLEVKEQALTLSLSARPRGDRDLQKLTLVMLWVNDFRARVWSPATDPAAFKPDGSFDVPELAIPQTALRTGPNVLTLQCYNKAGGRGEAVPVSVARVRPRAEPRLFGLAVGVGDYSQSELRKQKSKVRLIDLNADKDARAIAEMWQEQAGKNFKFVEIKTLTNQAATPRAILDWLQTVSQQVRPDDRVLLFLGGHGTSAEELERIVKLTKTPVLDTLSPRSFAMLGPDFDIGRPNKTGITSQDMYEAITRINCHKLVLLDACHSGAIAANPVRDLTRDGVGPVIVAACAPNEQAIEFGLLDANRAFGLFTMTLRRALEEEFAEADTNHDGFLTSAELVDYVATRVPKLVEQLKEDRIEGIRPGDTQTPSVFLPRLERGLTWAKN